MLINIHKYANEIIYIIVHNIKAQCLGSITILLLFFYHKNWQSCSGFPEALCKTERLPWKRQLKKSAPLSGLSSTLADVSHMCTTPWYMWKFSTFWGDGDEHFPWPAASLYMVRCGETAKNIRRGVICTFASTGAIERIQSKNKCL